MPAKSDLIQRKTELLKDSSDVFLKNALLTVARGFVGVKETGNNDGEIINLFQKSVDGKADNEPWCVGFAWFCIQEAESLIEEIFDITLDIKTKVHRTESAVDLWNKTPKQNQLIKPEPGCLVVWQRYVDDKPTWQGHIGIVTKVLDEQTVKTIEGNSSPDGLKREGHGVFEHTRFFQHRINNLRLKGFLRIW